MTDKPIDFSAFRDRRKNERKDRSEQERQIGAQLWTYLCVAWERYGKAIGELPPTASGLSLSTDPGPLFAKLVENLMLIAECLGTSHEEITFVMLNLILTVTPPEEGGRLNELIQRAHDLLESGDEEATIKDDPEFK